MNHPSPAIASPAEQAAANRALVPLKVLESFQSQTGGFAAGDVAGFERATADQLVKAGMASYDLAATPREVAERPFSPPREFGQLAGYKVAGAVAVEIVKAYPPFMVGEVAGFSEPMAVWLVQNGHGKLPGPKKDAKRTLKAMREALRG